MSMGIDLDIDALNFLQFIEKAEEICKEGEHSGDYYCGEMVPFEPMQQTIERLKLHGVVTEKLFDIVKILLHDNPVVKRVVEERNKHIEQWRELYDTWYKLRAEHYELQSKYTELKKSHDYLVGERG